MIEILFIALVSACFTDFLDDCMSTGMIFAKYGEWVRSKEHWIFKPLGGCIQCFGVWLTLFMILLYYKVSILFIIFGIIGLSNKILKWLVSNTNG